MNAMADHLPLNAMRAFEVAARTGSFVAAGLELGVSSAAVSQQVKSLEATLNKTVFLRQGNRITLTEAGRALYPRLETVFTDLVALTKEMRTGPQRSRLVISALPSLAELWLLPALASYADRHTIDLRIGPDPTNFAHEGVDVRVTYGGHYYPDHQVQLLFQDHFIAVAAPEVAAVLPADPADFPDRALIHTQWGTDFVNQPDWTHWFAAAGAARLLQSGVGLSTHQTQLSVVAARAGMGIALVPARFAAPDIAKGTLCRVGQTAVPLTWDYVLVHPVALERRAAIVALKAHLMRIAKTQA